MIVLDTHAWLWWSDGDARLPASTRRRIDRAGRLGVPTACCFELASLDRRGRIRLDRGVRAWVRTALDIDGVEALPITADVAIEAGRLPENFPGDPLDRLIYATAVSENALLVTRDERITAHDPTRVIW